MVELIKHSQNKKGQKFVSAAMASFFTTEKKIPLVQLKQIFSLSYFDKSIFNDRDDVLCMIENTLLYGTKKIEQQGKT